MLIKEDFLFLPKVIFLYVFVRYFSIINDLVTVFIKFRVLYTSKYNCFVCCIFYASSHLVSRGSYLIRFSSVFRHLTQGAPKAQEAKWLNWPYFNAEWARRVFL